MTTPAPLPPLPPGQNGSPPRQASPADIAAAATFYTTVIQPWLTAITGPLLPAPRVIDPFGALTANRLWAAGMKRWITGQVLPQLRRPLQYLFGADRGEVIFDQLPYAVDYASTLQNFMVNVPDEVFAKVRAQVQTAADEGLSIPDLADQIKQTLLDNGSAYWQGRGEMVARTELRAATQGGLINAYTEHGNQRDIEYIKQWLDSHDTRVRPAHVNTDGQRRKIGEPYAVGTADGLKYPAMHPGALTLPADSRINCRCDQLIEEAGERMTNPANRGYRG